MATLTINFTAPNATRLQNALQESLALEDPATLADLKEYVMLDLRQLVRTSERRVAAAAATPGPDVVIT